MEANPEVIEILETRLDAKYKVVMDGYTIYRSDGNGDGGVLIAMKVVLK